MNLEECRKEIDEIDEIMLDCFIKRMKVVKNVINYKIEHNLPILNTQREKELIQDKKDKTPDEFKEYVAAFFQNLMENSRAYQQVVLNNPFNCDFVEQDFNFDAKVACQGVMGAYSHIAAKKYFKEDNLSFYETFDEVFEAVKNGEVTYGVIPIENSTAGGIFEVYDLLKEYDLFINKSYSIKIEHTLVAKNTQDISKINKVYTHYQAIKQCSNFLKENPHIQVCEDLNTAIAAKRVMDSQEMIAAICSKEAAHIYGLNVLKENVQNNDENRTKFIVISKQILNNDDFDEISICIKIPNKSGELNLLLTKFTLAGINLDKIQSRPLVSKDFSVLFYINFKGNLKKENVMHLLADLNQNYEYIKVLGAYKNTK